MSLDSLGMVSSKNIRNLIFSMIIISNPLIEITSHNLKIMNTAKQSLEQNKAEILAALPEEFQEDFKKELDAMPNTAPAPVSSEDEVAAIKAELVANPSVNEKEAAPELKDITAPERLAPQTEEEKKALIAEALKDQK